MLTMEEYRFRSYLLFLMGYGGPRWFKIIAFIWQTRTTLGNFTCKEWMVDELPFVPFFQSQSRTYHGGVSFLVVSFAPNGLWWAKMVQNHRLYKANKNYIGLFHLQGVDCGRIALCSVFSESVACLPWWSCFFAREYFWAHVFSHKNCVAAVSNPTVRTVVLSPLLLSSSPK